MAVVNFQFCKLLNDGFAYSWPDFLDGLGYPYLLNPCFENGCVILEIHDATQQPIDTGQPYQTQLDPPPADPRVAHPSRETDAERQ